MDILIFFLIALLFFGFVLVREARDSKRRKEAFIRSLYDLSQIQPKKEYSAERYLRIPGYYIRHMQDGQVDDITWNDLNMDELFKRMNYTFSATGEEYLYYTLRNTARTEEELEHLEQVIRYFAEHDKQRVDLQYRMSRLGYTGKYSLYDYIGHLDYLGERSNRRHIVADLLFLPCIALLFVDFSVGLAGLLALIIFNIMTYFKEKNETDPYLISFAYVLKLMTVCEELVTLLPDTCALEKERIQTALQQLSGLKRGTYWVMAGNRHTGSGNPLELIADYIRMVFHVDLIQFNRMLSLLRRKVAYVEELTGVTGYLETAVAIGLFRHSLDTWCNPEWQEADLDISEAYHPLLSEPVKNSIRATRGVLITGSNASGKSTFLKTIGINAILAQTIHTCAATQYRAPLYRIYSSMALRDNLESGESYYIVEIKSLKRILDAGRMEGRKLLCFVDEVLRGTNTVERIAASAQILGSLSADTFQCFAATHDIELTELLKEQYDNYHFEERVEEGDISFPYLLYPGKATSRNAIKLLELMGYEAEIIDRANRSASEFLEKGVWC